MGQNLDVDWAKNLDVDWAKKFDVDWAKNLDVDWTQKTLKKHHLEKRRFAVEEKVLRNPNPGPL